MNNALGIALIAGGAGVLGAGLTVLGNYVVGGMNRATQREQLRAAQLAASQADQRALRDGTAGRLREAYGQILEATITWYQGTTHENGQALRRSLFLTLTTVLLEPGAEGSVEVFGALADAVVAATPDIHAIGQAIEGLEKFAQEHINQFQQPIPPPPP